MAQTVKNLPAMREGWVQFLGQEDPLELEMEWEWNWNWKWNTGNPVFLPGESHGKGPWRTIVHGVTKSHT